MKTKRPYYTVKDIADQLVDKLVQRNAVTRIEIAGSLRRREDEIGDIEIVAMPKPVVDLFGDPTGKTYVDLALQEWGVVLVKNGQKYKQFEFATAQGHWYQVDMFLQPDPATWGVNMMIRTGPDSFSKKMVTPKWQNGYMPNEYMVDKARVWNRYSGECLETPEEKDIFRLWKMDFVPPQNRE